MKNLWTFGPSVAQLTDYRNNNNTVHEQWLNQIATKLGYMHNANALAGCSQEYIYKKFHDTKNDVNIGDAIIVVTAPIYDRHWFFPDRPNVTTPDFVTNAQELNAFKQYLLYLDNNIELKKINFYNFLESLHRTTCEKHTKTIVMPAWEDEQQLTNAFKKDFPNIYFVDDNLVTVITGEFDKKYTKKEALNIMADDRRFCHMLKSNHTILANKFIEYILYNKDIKLNNMLTEVINDDFFKQDNTNELFGMNWN